MIGVMNNTKWEELRQAMYAMKKLSPRFRIKDLGDDQPTAWDGEWYYHFRGAGYGSIEWVELSTPIAEQRDAVRNRLHEIHLPGIETAEGFRIIGWIKPGESVGYIG